MQVDDLFKKIGILTVENDMLRAELNRVMERIQELEQVIAQAEDQTVNAAVKEK